MAKRSPHTKKRQTVTSGLKKQRSAKKEIYPLDLPTEERTDLPLTWVDHMMMSVRSDLPVATLRFYSVLLPDSKSEVSKSEVCRLQTSVDHLKRMVDVFCRTTNYYPERPKGKK
jgi:hypothetical protein